MRLLVLVAIVLAAAPAHAQSFEVSPERAGDARALRVTVHGVGAAMGAHAVLSWGEGFAEPSARQPFRTGPDPIAIMIVIEGQELFMGNDVFETDLNATYAGALTSLEAGIDAMHLERLVPAGSTIEVVTYSVGATILVPSKPVTAFHGADLGAQRDFRSKIGDDMVAGIELGGHELDQSTAPLKLMFVLGDGDDTNRDQAKHQLQELAVRLTSHQISVAAAIYKTPMSADGNIIHVLVPNAPQIAADDAANALGQAIDRITDRMYLTFADESLPWDGGRHTFTLTIASTALPPVTITMPGHPASRLRWYQILFGIAVVALIAAVIANRRGR